MFFTLFYGSVTFSIFCKCGPHDDRCVTVTDVTAVTDVTDVRVCHVSRGRVMCHTRELYMLIGLGVSDYWHEEQPLNESSVHSSGHHTHSQHSTGGNGTLWSTDPQSEVSSIKMLLGVFGSHFGSLLYSFVAVADRLCWYQISLSWPYSDILKYRYFMWIASNSQLRK